MSEMLFIFTFGPIQSFITEARRGQDLFAGSRILSDLAGAVLAELVQRGAKPVYPLTGADNTPNKLVLLINSDKAQDMGDWAKCALEARWKLFADKARTEILRWRNATPDNVWDTIWERQIKNVWDCYWVAVPAGNDYGKCYQEANRNLDAVKRVRPFAASNEDGLKDTLSGRRSALRTVKLDAKQYWASVADLPQITGAKLQPGGRERLDALGTIKRFGLKLEKIPSVSTVATADFLARAREKTPDELKTYREQVGGLDLFTTTSDPQWPYDGDLLYLEGLTPESLADSYGQTTIDNGRLDKAKEALRALYKKLKQRPRTYYAILSLDGDSMGKTIDKCKTAQKHTEFSEKVNQFASEVGSIINVHHGSLVYAGGDDVLALLPVSTAIDAARQLAKRFEEITGNHASAGIAITHHNSPLSIALSESRSAEQMAKRVENKNAIAVKALKRSGETLSVASHWEYLNTFEAVVKAIQDEVLSSRFPYDLRGSARSFAKADDSFGSEMKRLLKRHTMKPKDGSSVAPLSSPDFTDNLYKWASALEQPDTFADWMLLARFMTQGDVE